MAHLSDVAERAEVSLATASRVLSESDYPVSDGIRERVLRAAKELDFQPNLIARGLAARRTSTIGLIVHDMADEFFGQIALGVEEVAYANGYSTLICNTDRDPAKELRYIRKLRAMQVDGAIFSGGEMEDPDVSPEIEDQVEQLRSEGRALVRLAPGRRHPADITYSNEEGFRLIVDHLRTLGHRRLVFIGGPANLVTAQERMRAVTECCDGRAIDLIVIPGDFTRESGRYAGVKIREEAPEATAVIAANDQMAIGALKGLRERSVRVPEQLSVVGFDDIPPCEYVDPPLTTVRVPLRELGRRGMKRLMSELADDPLQEDEETLPISLVVRDSTAHVDST